MRNVIMLTMLLLVVGIVTAQEKEKRSVADFNRIDVASGIDLYLTQADAIDVEVVCKKDDLHRLVTEVEGNTLKVYMKGNFSWNWSSSSTPKVYVSFKQMEALSASGGSDVYGQNVIAQAYLKLTSSGGSDVYIEVKSEDVKISTSGGSDIKINGTTNKLTATSSGGSDINARDLKAETVKVTSSGGSDAVVWAKKEIVANASGGSDIVFYGNPEHKQLNESGAGDITQR